MTAAVSDQTLRLTRNAKIAGVLLLVLNVADLVLTFVVLSRGGVEMNPISAWLIERSLIIPLKVGICAWIAFSVFFLERSVNTLQYRILLGVVGIYALVVSWNLFVLTTHL